jgi:transcriptional regulator with XRE-family HTH domain
MKFEIPDDLLADPELSIGPKVLYAVIKTLPSQPSNAELARMFGVSQTTIANWLSGGRNRKTRVHLPASFELCSLLADLIEMNGSKRPTITESWLTAADQLQQLDGKTPDQIGRAIRWAQKDTFWRMNIMSMQKLRQHYDRLRLTAISKQQQTSNALLDYVQNRNQDGA